MFLHRVIVYLKPHSNDSFERDKHHRIIIVNLRIGVVWQGKLSRPHDKYLCFVYVSYDKRVMLLCHIANRDVQILRWSSNEQPVAPDSCSQGECRRWLRLAVARSLHGNAPRASDVSLVYFLRIFVVLFWLAKFVAVPNSVYLP